MPRESILIVGPCRKKTLTCQYDSQSDQKPERVDRKGLLGPGDGNARWIRLKIEELIDGIVSWQRVFFTIGKWPPPPPPLHEVFFVRAH